jgi:polygalacturonase
MANPAGESSGEPLRLDFDPFIPTFNVKAFGAHGDGVHDDTAAITAAIDASNAANFAGSGSIGFFSAPNVYFPAGIYLIRAIIRSLT